MRWIAAAIALGLALAQAAIAEPTRGSTIEQTPSNAPAPAPAPRSTPRPAPAAPAHAPTSAPSASTTAAQVQGLADWNGRLEHVLVAMMAPFRDMPTPPTEDMGDAARHEWAANARAWMGRSQTAFAAVQAELDQLPASPPADAPISPDLRTALERMRASLPEAMARANDLVQSYGPMAEAFEQRQNGVVRQFRVRAIDSSLLTLNLFHDANVSQATVLPSASPQAPLLMSYARSYEGFAALLTFKRQVMLTGQPDAATAANAATALNATEQQMRTLVGNGRLAAHSMLELYGDTTRFGADDAPLVRRVEGVLATYDGSFDRELRIADEAHAIATLLGDTRSFDVVEPEIDAHMTRFSDLDAERMVDAQRRQAIMAGH
jgi:hypothetical protein